MFSDSAQHYTWGKPNTHVSTRTSCQLLAQWKGDDLGLLCSHETWGPYSH